MKKTITILITSILLSSFATIKANAQTTNTSEEIVGIWAMHPLKNGIANVVDIRENGETILYPFNCETRSNEKPEPSTYSIKDEKYIEIGSGENSQTLEIVEINENSMTLSQSIGDYSLSFKYEKTNKINSMCELYYLYKNK